jgi:ribosomal protein S18 acetylase RimI-like enzyme
MVHDYPREKRSNMTATAIRTRTTSNVYLHVGAPEPAVAAEAAALLNESLGAGFIRPSDLAELTASHGGVLIRGRNRPGQLFGAATARRLDQGDVKALQDLLSRAGVEAGLDGHRVGELKSIVVAPTARGMGLGTAMLAASLDFLKACGCRYIVSASWVSADPQQSSLRMLERAGFAQMATIPSFWADDQKAAGYLCPECGAECVCAAVILVLPLEDWPVGPR